MHMIADFVVNLIKGISSAVGSILPFMSKASEITNQISDLVRSILGRFGI
jgi:hypothetical protein